MPRGLFNENANEPCARRSPIKNISVWNGFHRWLCGGKERRGDSSDLFKVFLFAVGSRADSLLVTNGIQLIQTNYDNAESGASMENRKTIVARRFANARNAIIYLLGLYSVGNCSREQLFSNERKKWHDIGARTCVYAVFRELLALFNVSLSRE